MVTKKDITAAFAQKFGVTKVLAEEMVRSALDLMHDSALESEAAVFGPHKMMLKTTAARAGRNPQTGEHIDIPQKSKVVYKRMNRE